MGSSTVSDAVRGRRKIRSTGREKTAPGCKRMHSKRSNNQSNCSFIRKDVSLKPKGNKFDTITDQRWTDKISECPSYYPSKEEFEDPLTYLRRVAPEASKYGICKIVSPWKASIPASDVLMKEKKGFEFETYVQPLRLAEWNVNDKATFFEGESKYTYQSFERMANEAFVQRFPHSRCLSPANLEKKFWNEMAHGSGGTVEYGVNVDGSAFSSDPNDELGTSKWNLKTVSQLPKSIFRLLEYPIPGITDPMLYIGMLFSMFTWHIEDHYLYSINYHHSGAPKTWYGVPGDAALPFEKVVMDHVYADEILSTEGEDGAFEILSEKTTMFPPNILLKHNIPVYKAVQMAGEFVITFPRAYHAGFSHGFNCGEAVNFAFGDWFPWGEMAGKRYALLNKMVILPFEELLCKEGILLSKCSRNRRSSDYSSAELTSHVPVKVSFLQRIQFINNALWRLNNLNALFSYSPSCQGTILCQLCKRDCYLAFLECNHCYHHMCLFHEVKSLDCLCSGKRLVFVRDDIWLVVEAAQKLGGEGILQQRQIKQEKSRCSQPDLLSFIQDGFARYCKTGIETEQFTF